MKYLALVAVAALLGCTDSAVTSSITAPRAPSLGIYDASRPTATNVVATRVDATTVRLTFTDNAEDETLWLAYFTSFGDTGPTSTSNPIFFPEAGLGERDVNVYATAADQFVRLRARWGPFPCVDCSAVVWGPFSAVVPVSEAVVVTLTRKGKK